MQQTRRDDYTETERIMALSIVAETGNKALAAERTGIPASTVWGWAERAERDNTLDELRAAIRFRLAHRYVELAVRAVDVLEARLIGGDPHVTRGGAIVFAPIKARDAALIASICTDKHALITGQLQGRKDVTGHLHALADKLTAALRQTRARDWPEPDKADDGAGSEGPEGGKRDP